MKKKIIFRKKKIPYKRIFLLIILIFLIFPSIFIFKNRNQFFIIEEYTGDYFIIPTDKKGKKIPNIYKQVLHLHLNKESLLLKKNDLMKYSIQFFASIYYEEVINKFEFYIRKDIFNQNDFSIVVLDHFIGQEYLLLYKNFETMKLAYDYCVNYLEIINTCLVVNVQNLD